MNWEKSAGPALVPEFPPPRELLTTEVLRETERYSETDRRMIWWTEALSVAFHRSQAHFLVISFTSDWRFSPARSREIVQALIRAGREASYVEIPSEYGHDAFLMPIPLYHDTLRSYLTRIAREVNVHAA